MGLVGSISRRRDDDDDDKKGKKDRISAGPSHFLVLDEQGYVYSFGSDTYGQLGRGKTAKIPSLKDIVSVSAGLNHSLFLNNNGEIFFCGWRHSGITKIKKTNDEKAIPKIISMSSSKNGGEHLLLGEGNELFTLFVNYQDYKYFLQSPPNLYIYQLKLPPWLNVVSMNATHEVLLSNKNKVFVFDIENRKFFNKPINPRGVQIVRMSTGRGAVFLSEENKIFILQSKNKGLGYCLSEILCPLPNIKKISVTSSHILMGDGSVLGYGTNSRGELGLEYKNKTSVYPPKKLSLQNIVSIAAGNGYSLFLNRKGILFYCGAVYDNLRKPQFGINSHTPTEIYKFPSFNKEGVFHTNLFKNNTNRNIKICCDGY